MTTLLAVAHGTADPNGVAEVRRLTNLVRTRRTEIRLELAWLERASPSLPEVLAEIDGPVVVVPLLLSTGYHVKVDIRAAVADRPDTAVAEQLGPDDRITRVVLDRLLATGCCEPNVVLFGAGSSDPEGVGQLEAVGARLEEMLRARDEPNARVFARTLIDPEFERDLPATVDVANYLLAPGHFNDLVTRRGSDLGAEVVAAPIGAHPAIAAVVWDRFDRAVADAGF